MMTESSFIKVCDWLRSQYRKQNSIHIVFPNMNKKIHEAWKYDNVIGNDTINLKRSNGRDKDYSYKKVTKKDFESLDHFLGMIHISLSTESIRKSYREELK